MHIRTPVEWLFTKANETADQFGGARPREYWGTEAVGRPVVQRIGMDDLRTALQAGWQDFAAARTDVIFVSLIYPVIGLFIVGVVTHMGALPLLFPIASGFALLGPFAAIGLYELSRRREMTGNANWFDAFQVFRSPAIGSIIGLGLILVGLFIAWLFVARGIYDVTLGPLPPANAGAFLAALFGTAAGWAMILLGMAVGAVFAAVALVIGAFSFPLLLDRPMGLGLAVKTSWQAARLNPYPLAVWGASIAAALFIGSLPFFLGIAVVLPVAGHATWHLYRRTVA